MKAWCVIGKLHASFIIPLAYLTAHFLLYRRPSGHYLTAIKIAGAGIDRGMNFGMQIIIIFILI
jgi:hypothetical protein